VLTAFCEQYGLDAKLAFGFGVGICSAKVCSVVSGALLVIGLKYSQSKLADKADINNCYAKTVEFLDSLKQLYGSIVCRDLLELHRLGVKADRNHLLRRDAAQQQTDRLAITVPAAMEIV